MLTQNLHLHTPGFPPSHCAPHVTHPAKQPDGSARVQRAEFLRCIIERDSDFWEIYLTLFFWITLWNTLANIQIKALSNTLPCNSLNWSQNVKTCIALAHAVEMEERHWQEDEHCTRPKAEDSHQLPKTTQWHTGACQTCKFFPVKPYFFRFFSIFWCHMKP